MKLYGLSQIATTRRQNKKVSFKMIQFCKMKHIDASTKMIVCRLQVLPVVEKYFQKNGQIENDLRLLNLNDKITMYMMEQKRKIRVVYPNIRIKALMIMIR